MSYKNSVYELSFIKTINDGLVPNYTGTPKGLMCGSSLIAL